MDWDRIENARNRARSIFAITFVVIALVVFAASTPGSHGQGPMFGGPRPGLLGIPIDTLTLAFGVFGVLVGLTWMWRIYRAPTKVEGAHWRFHDD
jgi:polyferredoxin